LSGSLGSGLAGVRPDPLPDAFHTPPRGRRQGGGVMTRPVLPDATASPVDSDDTSRRVVPIHDRLTWGLDDLEALTGLSRRTLERERSAGRLPRPDLRVGRRVLWKPATILAWLERGGA